MSNSSAKEVAERLQKTWNGPMTPKEVIFLQDVEGLINFSTRNGLSFSVVVALLLGDLNEVARNGFDFEKTLASGFLPRVTGYRNLTSDSFGDSPEEEPGDQ
jgi:hypothetical protein